MGIGDASYLEQFRDDALGNPLLEAHFPVRFGSFPEVKLHPEKQTLRMADCMTGNITRLCPGTCSPSLIETFGRGGLHGARQTGSGGCSLGLLRGGRRYWCSVQYRHRLGAKHSDESRSEPSEAGLRGLPLPFLDMGPKPQGSDEQPQL